MVNECFAVRHCYLIFLLPFFLSSLFLSLLLHSLLFPPSLPSFSPPFLPMFLPSFFLFSFIPSFLPSLLTFFLPHSLSSSFFQLPSFLFFKYYIPLNSFFICHLYTDVSLVKTIWLIFVSIPLSQTR